MRHRKTRYQFNRYTSWRTATLKSLLRSLLLNESIKTTLTRAKACQPAAEKLISWAKEGTLERKRRAFDLLQDHTLVKMLFAEVAPRFKSRSSGFTRILKYAIRRGDSAELVIFELTERKPKEKKTKAAKAAVKEAGEQLHEEKPAARHEAPAAESEGAAPKEKHKEHKDKDQKPQGKFLGGIRNIFKKERDSL